MFGESINDSFNRSFAMLPRSARVRGRINERWHFIKSTRSQKRPRGLSSIYWSLATWSSTGISRYFSRRYTIRLIFTASSLIKIVFRRGIFRHSSFLSRFVSRSAYRYFSTRVWWRVPSPGTLEFNEIFSNSRRLLPYRPFVQLVRRWRTTDILGRASLKFSLGILEIWYAVYCSAIQKQMLDVFLQLL